jgi:uncharacterized delta-60 repeat protein
MKKGLGIVSFFLFLSISLFAQEGTLDQTFNSFDNGNNYSVGANGNVKAIKVQTDGKALIGGTFTTYNAESVNYITRLNADGSKDATFNVGGLGTNGVVNTIAVQSDNKIIIGGSFSTYNGVSVGALVRINSNGTLDNTFNVGGVGLLGEVLDIIVVSGNKIIAAGNISSYNNAVVNNLIQIKTNGTLESTFNAGGAGVNGTVYSLALQSNGKILVGGNVTTFNNIPVNYIFRINSNGSYDNSFVNNGEIIANAVKTIAIQPDGKILAGCTVVSRLNSNGTVDASFNYYEANANIIDGINKIVLQNDGKFIMITGQAKSRFFDLEEKKIFRRNSNGTNDDTFLYELQYINENIYSIALNGNGKILLGQEFISSFGRPGYGKASSVHEGLLKTNLICYNSNGSINDTFNIATSIKGVNGNVKTSTTQADGKLLVGGSFTNYNGELSKYLVRLNADGTRDYGFNIGSTGANNTIISIALQADGKIVICGHFTKYNNKAANGIARLNSNGSLDTTFNFPGIGVYSSLFKISVAKDQKIYFSSDQYGKTIAKLNIDGSFDLSFNCLLKYHQSGMTYVFGKTYCITHQDDGKIVLGGFFDQIGPYPTGYNATPANIVRINENGSLDSTFLAFPNFFYYNNSYGFVGFDGYSYSTAQGFDGYVYSTAIQPNGKILVGGRYTKFKTFLNTKNVNNITRLNSDGNIDTTFNVGGSGFNGTVSSISILPNGKILVSGSFSSYNNIAVSNIVRLKENGSYDSSFNLNLSAANAAVYAISANLDNSKIIIGGAFTSYNAIGKNRIARLINCAKSISTTNLTICSNQLPYSWNGRSYTTSGVYTSTLNNINSCDSTAILNLKVPVGGAENIVGPTRSCKYLMGSTDTAVYSINAVSGSTITWSVSNVSTMQILSGQGTNSIKVQYSIAFTTGNVIAKIVLKSCNVSATKSLAISKTIPTTPGVITAGTTNICPLLENYDDLERKVVYTIRKVANATGYLWNAPTNTTVIYHPNGTGENDTTIVLFITDNYNFVQSILSVQSKNDCGISAARTFTISRINPATPGVISGPISVCNYVSTNGIVATYSVAPVVNATSYLWTLPNGVTDVVNNYSNTISFRYPTGFVSGTVSVKAANGCGLSTARTLNVSRLAASMPGAITTKLITACSPRIYTYSIAAFPTNTNTINWTVPSGGTILSGQGTISIQVSYVNTNVVGTVNVQSFNNCSSSTIRFININLPACTAVTNPVTKMDSEIDEIKNTGLQIFPNPSTALFTLKMDEISVANAEVKILDVSGRMIEVLNTKGNKLISFGSRFLPGVYFVQIKQNNKVITKKIVKQ